MLLFREGKLIVNQRNKSQCLGNTNSKLFKIQDTKSFFFYCISFISIVKEFSDNDNFTIWLKSALYFSLSHRESDNSLLLIVFNANYINQSILTFMQLNVG